MCGIISSFYFEIDFEVKCHLMGFNYLLATLPNNTSKMNSV